MTVIVAVTTVEPVLLAVKLPMFPVPEAPRPIDGVSLVQLYDVPVPEKVIALTLSPLHAVTSDGSVTDGVGLTVIVNVLDVPEHPLYTGVTVIVAVTGVLPVLLAVNDPMLPVPLAARPIDAVLFVQL